MTHHSRPVAAGGRSTYDAGMPTVDLPSPPPDAPTQGDVVAVRRGYALGSVATGTFGTVPGLLLLPYLTDRLGVAAGLAGLVVVLPKAWDVLLNPVVGRSSDRRAAAGGSRRSFLLVGGVGLAVAFALLFAGPATPRGLATTWVVVLFLACATAYAVFQVPYVALPAEITDDPQERTRIMSWRVAVLALAILASGASAPAIRTAVGPEQGYRVMGALIGLLILLGALGAWWGTRRAPVRRVVVAEGGLGAQLRLVASDRAFRSLLLTFLLQALATGSMLAGVDYVARELLHDPAAGTLLFVCFVGPAVVCTPLWQRVGTTGKRRGYVVASLVLVVGALGAGLAGHAPAALVYVAVAVVGVGYAGAQMFPLAMLPDVAARDAVRSGENRIGVYTGVWTAGETLGLALGPGLYGLVLAIGGYVSSTGDGAVAQPASATTAIGLGFSVVPAVLVLLSLLALRRHHPEAVS